MTTEELMTRKSTWMSFLIQVANRERVVLSRIVDQLFRALY